MKDPNKRNQRDAFVVHPTEYADIVSEIAAARSAAPLIPSLCHRPQCNALSPCPMHESVLAAAPLIPGHFDTPPQNAITAEQVREWKDSGHCPHDPGDCSCSANDIQGNTLRGLLTHPGVSSAARAVIEAALE